MTEATSCHQREVGQKKIQMCPHCMCVLVAEYLGGGLSEFWACDQGSEDLVPFGSCKCGVMARKPEQNDDEE